MMTSRWLWCALLAGCCVVSSGCLLNKKQASLPQIDPPQDEWFQQNVVDNPLPVLVDFNATWCGPCRMMQPHLERLEKEFAGRLVVTPIDVDERRALALHYQVEGIPYLLLMQGGRVLAAETGFLDYQGLTKFVEPHLAPGSAPAAPVVEEVHQAPEEVSPLEPVAD